jgi:hypothetical protein
VSLSKRSSHPARERVEALLGRRPKSPSHVEELRSAVVRELEDWTDGLVIAPMNLVAAVEQYDDERERLAAQGKVYRDYCNTCGAKRNDQHEERCPVNGVVVAWSGIVFPEDKPDA